MSPGGAAYVPLSAGPPAGVREVVAFNLTRDGLSLFLTRALRLYSYGAIAPVFFLYCVELGLSEFNVGVLLTLILVGDLVITLYLSTSADSFGRRKVLVIGSWLKVLAGVAFASTRSFPVLVVAGVVGVISTSGGECGPFINVEQAALTDAILATPNPADGSHGGAGRVAVLFGWYNALGYSAQALGSLSSGLAVRYLPFPPLLSHRIIFAAYGLVGTIMALLYGSLSPAVESPAAAAAAAAAAANAALGGGEAGARSKWWLPKVSLGLRRPESKYVVARLSVLFALDAFGGAFVMQSFVAFWYTERWQLSADLIGYLLMAANIVAGLSGIVAAELVRKIGAMLTMVVTHLPSNLLLMAVPLMPSGPSAAGMLVARSCIGSMDVPARQAYVAMSVASDERSAAGGITNIVRSLGMSAAPLLLGFFSSARPRSGWLFAVPWLIAGGVKCVYDVTLYLLYLLDTKLNTAEESAAAAEAARAAEAAEVASGAAAAPAAVVAIGPAPDDEGGDCALPLRATEGAAVRAAPEAAVVAANAAPPTAAAATWAAEQSPQMAAAGSGAEPLPPWLTPPPPLEGASSSADAGAASSSAAAAEMAGAAGAAAGADDRAAAPLVVRKKPKRGKKKAAGDSGGELARPLLCGDEEEAPSEEGGS